MRCASCARLRHRAGVPSEGVVLLVLLRDETGDHDDAEATPLF